MMVPNISQVVVNEQVGAETTDQKVSGSNPSGRTWLDR
jgi:hypothetical protein